MLTMNGYENVIYSGSKAIFLDNEGSSFERGRRVLEDRDGGFSKLMKVISSTTNVLLKSLGESLCLV